MEIRKGRSDSESSARKPQEIDDNDASRTSKSSGVGAGLGLGSVGSLALRFEQVTSTSNTPFAPGKPFKPVQLRSNSTSSIITTSSSTYHSTRYNDRIDTSQVLHDAVLSPPKTEENHIAIHHITPPSVSGPSLTPFPNTKPPTILHSKRPGTSPRTQSPLHPKSAIRTPSPSTFSKAQLTTTPDLASIPSTTFISETAKHNDHSSAQSSVASLAAKFGTTGTSRTSTTSGRALLLPSPIQNLPRNFQGGINDSEDRDKDGRSPSPAGLAISLGSLVESAFPTISSRSMPEFNLDGQINGAKQVRSPEMFDVSRSASGSAGSEPSLTYIERSRTMPGHLHPVVKDTFMPSKPARDMSPKFAPLPNNIIDRTSTQYDSARLLSRTPPPPPLPLTNALPAVHITQSIHADSRAVPLVQSLHRQEAKTATPPEDFTEQRESAYIPPLPPIRNVDRKRPLSRTPSPAVNLSSSVSSIAHPRINSIEVHDAAKDGSLEENDNDDKIFVEEEGFQVSDMPDAMFASRRPPKLSPERSIALSIPVHILAVCGRYAVTATLVLKIWDTLKGELVGTFPIAGEHKFTALEFICAKGEAEEVPLTIWVGTKAGHLFEIDIALGTLSQTNASAHTHAILGIFQIPGNLVITICKSGKVQTWTLSSNPSHGSALASLPKTQWMSEKPTFVQAIGTQLWTSHGPDRHHAHMSSDSRRAVSRSPSIRIYDALPDNSFTLTPRQIYLPESAGWIGSVMACTTLPYISNNVYLAHDSGHVSIWSKDSFTCLKVLRLSKYAITSLQGVLDCLWTGNRQGLVHVYREGDQSWKVVKIWKAADEPIIGLRIDTHSITKINEVHVASYGREHITFWDGTMRADWLERAMLDREADFSTYRDIKALFLSWNIDSGKPTDLQTDSVNINFLNDVLSSSVASSLSDENPPEIIVFGFQEVVDLEDKKLTAKSMLIGKKREDHMFQDQISNQYMQWHDRIAQAVRTAMPSSAPYSVVHAESLIGLFTCIFVRNHERPAISDLARITVKTGMGGLYGNKGAICARFVLDDTSICFINCHLAAGQRAKRERNKDLMDILENKSAFLQSSSAVPGIYIGGNGQAVFDHEICFLSGDLNYRIDLPRSVVKANIRSNNHSFLLEHDQLLKEIASNQYCALRSFSEANISFAPTYKFDPGTNDYDTSEKERIPAWCDRILYRDAHPGITGKEMHSVKISPKEYRSWPVTMSDHKPVTGLFKIRIKKMTYEQRLKTWEQVNVSRIEWEKSLLEAARKYCV